jgi:hypothetical protein
LNTIEEAVDHPRHRHAGLLCVAQAQAQQKAEAGKADPLPPERLLSRFTHCIALAFPKVTFAQA